MINNSFFIKLIASITALCTPVMAIAANAAEKAPAATGPAIFTPNKLGNLILSIVLVIIAIFVFAYILKKLLYSRNNIGGIIKVISAMPIGTKERILLVETNGKLLLLGITTQQISTLHVFDESAEEFMAQHQDNGELNIKLSSFWKTQRDILKKNRN